MISLDISCWTSKPSTGAPSLAIRGDEIPFRKYADRSHPRILHHQRTDAMFSQLADGKFDVRCKVYRLDVVALDP